MFEYNSFVCVVCVCLPCMWMYMHVHGHQRLIGCRLLLLSLSYLLGQGLAECGVHLSAGWLAREL